MNEEIYSNNPDFKGIWENRGGFNFMKKIILFFSIITLAILLVFFTLHEAKRTNNIWDKEIIVERPDKIQFDSKDISENDIKYVYEKLVQRLYLEPEFSIYPKNADLSDEVEMYRNQKQLIEFVYDHPVDLSINYSNQYVITYKVTKIGFGIQDNIEHHIFLEHPVANKQGNKHTVLYSRDHYDEDKEINLDVIRYIEGAHIK